MQVIKKFEYEFVVYFDDTTDDDYRIEKIRILSSDEGFSEDEMIEIAKQVGGCYADHYEVIRSWYETV